MVPVPTMNTDLASYWRSSAVYKHQSQKSPQPFPRFLVSFLLAPNLSSESSLEYSPPRFRRKRKKFFPKSGGNGEEHFHSVLPPRACGRSGRSRRFLEPFLARDLAARGFSFAGNELRGCAAQVICGRGRLVKPVRRCLAWSKKSSAPWFFSLAHGTLAASCCLGRRRGLNSSSSSFGSRDQSSIFLYVWIEGESVPGWGLAMSVSGKLVSSSSSSSDLDPLLKDLTEKKLSFRKNVVSLAFELKDVRSKLASQEQLFARESQTRKVAETKARSMEDEVVKLQKCLQDKDEKLRLSTHSTEQYLTELDDLRTQLSSTQATAEASAASAKSAQQQCLSLLKELNEKDNSIKEHEVRVNKLGEQLDLLQKDLQARELSQRQLKDEVIRIEADIMDAVAKAGSKSNKDNELLKILSDVSPRNVQNLNNLLNAKDNEIARLREEIKILSAHWTNKTRELESQLEKHRRTDQELKKRVLKLEFCLQESQSQMRKLKRMGDKRDKALKELMDQVAMKQPNGLGRDGKEKFWENQVFKFIASMSMLALVILAKR